MGEVAKPTNVTKSTTKQFPFMMRCGFPACPASLLLDYGQAWSQSERHLARACEPHHWSVHYVNAQTFASKDVKVSVALCPIHGKARQGLLAPTPHEV